MNRRSLMHCGRRYALDRDQTETHDALQQRWPQGIAAAAGKRPCQGKAATMKIRKQYNDLGEMLVLNIVSNLFQCCIFVYKVVDLK